MEMGACQIAGEKLDPREEHFRIPSNHSGRSIFLRYLPSDRGKQVVLYVHGGTFPSALSVAHRFDGRSWRDELCDAGFHVWALDFHGFGPLSEPYISSANAMRSRGCRSSLIHGEQLRPAGSPDALPSSSIDWFPLARSPSGSRPDSAFDCQAGG